MFDKKADEEVKQEVATKLANTRRPQVFPPGKPSFPSVRVERSQTGELTLASLVGPKSWLMFHLFGANHGWLALTPAQWEANQDYTEMSHKVHNLEVVNDSAERGIKDIQDYANSANDGGHREKIQLVSSSHRIKLPEFKKNEMEEEL